MEHAFNFNMLPEGCVSTILSLTSPLDACRSSSVSTTFRSAADSDMVWDRFLPSDYRDIVSSSTTTVKFSSKKELFHRLCDDHVLIDGGKKSFRLEKSSGKKIYILSARDLSITWGSEPMYWSWIPTAESRFSEVAVLRTMCWLEIQGKINTQMLSPNTKYGAYLLLKIPERAYGLDLKPSETSVQVGNQVSSSTVYLRLPDSRKQQLESLLTLFYTNQIEMLNPRVSQGDGGVTRERQDGSMEIELGESFNSGEGDEEVKMSLMEVKGYHLKGGLIVEGIEVRPKH